MKGPKTTADGKIVVDATLLEQIEEVRESGETNMLDSRGVQAVANRRDLHALVIFIQDHRSAYRWGAMRGFVKKG